MNSLLLIAIVSGIFSVVGGATVALITLKTRNVTQMDVAAINADTADEISKREALQAQQVALDAERARLDRVRDELEKGRSMEMGSLKLQMKGMQEQIEAERQKHVREIDGLTTRIRDLERQLFEAYAEIRELQKQQRTGGQT